jgi:hypothetical protein
MWVKKLFITLAISAGILTGIALCLSIYMQQHLYLPSTSDAQLLEQLFPSDFPANSNVKILSSQGEGPRRVPRTIEIVVQIESYPRAVTCQGKVFFAVGDPMLLNVRWRTLQCAGQRRYMELAQIALQNGFEYSKCHNEKTALLLARWVKPGLLSMADIIFPAVKERVVALVADPHLLTLQASQDGGLFDTSKMILWDDVKSETEAGPGTSIILRCDGKLELFKIDPGLINNYTDIPAGDYLMPYTLEPFTLTPEK